MLINWAISFILKRVHNLRVFIILITQKDIVTMDNIQNIYSWITQDTYHTYLKVYIYTSTSTEFENSERDFKLPLSWNKSFTCKIPYVTQFIKYKLFLLSMKLAVERLNMIFFFYIAKVTFIKWEQAVF